MTYPEPTQYERDLARAQLIDIQIEWDMLWARAPMPRTLRSVIERLAISINHETNHYQYGLEYRIKFMEALPTHTQSVQDLWSRYASWLRQQMNCHINFQFKPSDCNPSMARQTIRWLDESRTEEKSFGTGHDEACLALETAAVTINRSTQAGWATLRDRLLQMLYNPRV